MNNRNIKSPGRRRFIKSIILSGTGAMMVPSVLSCTGKENLGTVRRAASGSGNLLINGDFELIDQADALKPSGWDVGPHKPGLSVTLSGDEAASGSRSVLQHRTVTEDLYYYLKQNVSLEPGEMYRLRFLAKADEKSKDLSAVCISAMGSEGPAWFYHPLHLKSGNDWQAVDLIFRMQSGFNPLISADIEFRLNQWRPDFAFRPNRPQDREVQQNLYIDSVSLVPVEEGSSVTGRLAPFLLVPGYDNLRMADVELGLGDGISFMDGSLKLLNDNREMKRVEYLEDITGPGQFAYSERSRRIFVSSVETEGNFELNFEAVKDNSGDAMLGISGKTGRALRNGTKEVTRIPMECDAKDFDRISWPITQGLSFPPGLLADLSSIRVLGPTGEEVPSQVKPASYWADDSVRWVLFDFCVSAPAGVAPVYTIETGPDIKRSEVSGPIQIIDNNDDIVVDSGKLKFRVSKNSFSLLEDLTVDGRTPLDGTAVLSVTEDNNKKFLTSGERPYSVVVEEAGPMRAVIAVTGWNTNPEKERFLTYTTRIHAYRDKPFVRIFHTLTNRHQEQVTGKHKYATGWPKNESEFSYREIPQRNVADARLTLKIKGSSDWSFLTAEGAIKGKTADGSSVHRQIHHAEGIINTPKGKINTKVVPGVVSVSGSEGTLTAALFRYSNLFPKEISISADALDLGIIPFSTGNPHPLLKGTARTTELLLSFDPAGSEAGLLAARCFTEPTILSNQEWYCSSRGFMCDPLVPVNKYTSGTYDRGIKSYVDNCSAPYPKGIDDCGLMNFGDFPYTGYNVWVNMEYDSDLGLYMYFARSGDRRAFVRGLDGSRHFLDADTGWYTGDFDSHGSDFPHASAHYSPGRPAGHIYTLGLIHYYLLTGDRRALEANRMANDCVNRVLYHRIHQYSSLRSEDDIVGPKRGYALKGGSYVSANSRNTSDPTRYALHSYLVTGEARFLEAAMSIAGAFVNEWPEVWRTDDDQYMHYRWPQVIGRLYDITGGEQYRDTILKCGKWILENPYSKYGELRISQSYGRGPHPGAIQNNTRMLFLTAWAWKITGERKYLDWMVNMFDAQIEQERHREIVRDNGKSLGKDADNPARGIAWVAPHRTVLIDPSHGRFQLVPPGEDIWKINIGNRSETALTGKMVLGPLPAGVEMETERDFALALEEEKTLEFKIRFTTGAAGGRVTIPYRITTEGTDGRKGERNSFFAAHLMKPRTEKVPELLFHATLDDDKPAFSHGGNGAVVLEVKDFVDGRIGKALGPDSDGWSFDIKGSIFADAGTFSIWVKPTERSRGSNEHGLFRILGHGWPFIGIFTHYIDCGNQPFSYQLWDRIGEWIHIAMRWDLKELSYFIDGKRVYKGKRMNFEIPTGELWGMPQEAAAFDDIRIYSVPLTDQKIEVLAKGESS